MPHLPSLPEKTTLLDVFKTAPAVYKPLIELHEAVMRGPSPLTPAERELIAARVSRLNACQYCAGVHGAAARALDADETGDPRLAPLLRYVEILTETPSRATEAEAKSVLEAGWPEQALHDAVAVCALYNFMNRLVEGLGIEADAAYVEAAGQRLAKDGYAAIIDLLGLANLTAERRI